jgi:uncharacterized protein YjbI with pentapeptide repeats
MKTPSELKAGLVAFIKHLYESDATSSSVVHWWWLKRLIDLVYRPTQALIYFFNYIPPFSWIYHAFEGIFGKNGYIGVGSMAGLYIAIYGVAQSSNQDELDRQERAIQKYEVAMKLANEKEKMHGMKGLVKLSNEAIQMKPVFRCPIKFGDCPSYWFELSQNKLHLMAEELKLFIDQCHKQKNCNQTKPAEISELFDLKYFKDDLAFIGYNRFDKLANYVANEDYLHRYLPTSITYQLFDAVTGLLDLRNLRFDNLDVSRWQLFHSKLDNTRFSGVSGDLLDMRSSVYRRMTFDKVNLTKWVNDGSLIYASHFNDSTLNIAYLNKGVSFIRSTFDNSQLTFIRMHDVSFANSTFIDTSITLTTLFKCANRDEIDFDKQSIKIDDIKQRLSEQGFTAAQAMYRKKLRCNVILPNDQECRFIGTSSCLTDDFKIVNTEKLTMTGTKRRSQ